MKLKDARMAKAESAVAKRQLSDDARDRAFRKQRDAERAAAAAKTERLKKLRLEKEAADRAASEAAKGN